MVVRKPSQQLPPVRVIEHLDVMVQRGIISDVLVVRYLEFIIHELMDETVVCTNRATMISNNLGIPQQISVPLFRSRIGSEEES